MIKTVPLYRLTLQSTELIGQQRKTIHLGGETISEVRNEIRNASTSSLWITESAIKYIYQNGYYSISSVESHHSNQYTLKTYPNPFIFHPVERIEVLLRQSHGGNDKRAYEQNTQVFGHVNTPPSDLNSSAPLSFAENLSTGIIVGHFSAEDPTIPRSHTGWDPKPMPPINSSPCIPLPEFFALPPLLIMNPMPPTTRFKYWPDEFNATVEGNFTITFHRCIRTISGGVNFPCRIDPGA